MPAPFPRPREGTPVKNAPTGFPLYVTKRNPRVVTAEVWAYLIHTAALSLPRKEEAQAVAFVEQAFEFFEAAANPRFGSRPLLYYYSFLNLAKTVLLINRVKLTAAPRHGISDPRENARKRLQLPGQRVRVERLARDHSQLFPEFVRLLGGTIRKPREFGIVSLLRQIPGIHRTFCKVTGERPSFLPVDRFNLFRNEGRIFSRMTLRRSDGDVESTLKQMRSRRSFRKVFKQVLSHVADQLWFETEPLPGVKRATDTAIRKLASRIRSIGVWSILTDQGHRYYLCTIPPRETLSPLASIYAVMFYLGSITRYKPYDFDRIVSQEFSWLINEFLRTQPVQFLYGLASHVAGVDVVRPMGVSE